jgi:hypothetical protein
MRKPRARLLVLALGWACAGPAAAWGDAGHEIVAAIAYARLKPAVRRAVDAMLAADPDPLTAPDFVSRATWADRYRDADRSGDKVHYLGTRQWHFVNVELDAGSLDAACADHPPLPPGVPASAGPAEACVVDKIEQFTAELKDVATPPPEKLLALKFLMHFIGDLHQPLHVADRHDRGGNDVPVFHGRLTHPDNLHAYWDTRLVESLGGNPVTVAASLGRAITRAEAKRWAAGSTALWARESFLGAKRVAYDFSGESMRADDDARAVVVLDATYDRRALPLVRQQLSKAGVRLAAVLNAAFK